MPPFSRQVTAAREMCHGVSKSGSPTPSDTMSFDCATMSKNLRMPLFGRSATCLAMRVFTPVGRARQARISSASVSSAATVASVTAPLIVTVFAQNVMSFRPSSIAFMPFAAAGAHVPFSMKPIFRFW